LKNFPNKYKILNNQEYIKGEYRIVPIRMEDRFKIMEWRNEQIDLLRQKVVLTKKMQDDYFENIIVNLFDKEEPNQILFSYLMNEEFIGYGGLVHIDWESKNAEISFLLATKMSSEKPYNTLINIFLILIEEVAKDVKLHKVFTYGYDVEGFRFKPLINQKYNLEATLKDHVLIDDKLKDVKIYAKIF
jgi:hypothetical protein